VEECGPCPVFASFTLVFALQLRKKHRKTSVRLRKTSVRVQYTYYQNTHTLQNPHKQTHYKTHTNNTYNDTNNNQTTQITTNVEECGPCPVFASFTLVYALQRRKKHRKTSVRVRKTSVSVRKTSVRVQYTYYQNTHTLQNPHKHTHYKTHSNNTYNKFYD